MSWVYRTSVTLYCASVLIYHASVYLLKGGKKNFWSFLYQRVGATNTIRKTTHCLAFWLLSDAVGDKDPKRICAAFTQADRIFQKIKLSRKFTIAVIEAAVWLAEQTIADTVFKYIFSGRSSLSAPGTLSRLKALYAWKFSKNVDEVQPLASPLTPHDSVLPFVDYYARASVAEALHKPDDALRFYRMALETIPYEYDERRRAEERCNSILREFSPEKRLKGSGVNGTTLSDDRV